MLMYSHLQGKGEMTTYWLLSGDSSINVNHSINRASGSPVVASVSRLSALRRSRHLRHHHDKDVFDLIQDIPRDASPKKQSLEAATKEF